MSLSGLKKQFNKANQFLSENIAGVKGTQLDSEYVELEKKVDVLDRLCRELDDKTLEYLQPNPTTRAKLSATQTFARMRGAAQAAPYPQAEGELGAALNRAGRELGADSLFGGALIDTGDTHRQLAECKYALEENVKMNFISSLRSLAAKELKEIAFHRKKTESRRLDYDCKKRHSDRSLKEVPGTSKVDDNEVRLAAEKFEESKQLAEVAMFNLIDNDAEQIAQLCAFVQAELDFHKQSATLLDRLDITLKEKVQQANSRPKRDHAPKRLHPSASSTNAKVGALTMASSAASSMHSLNTATSTSPNAAQPQETPAATRPSSIDVREATARVLYDFEAENPGELELKEGQTVKLIQQVDENWFEGEVNAHRGFFPISYVQVLVPLK